ncbi:hypothetical protein ONS95_013201 [Cadophora gregata]|uniref:uncharacterized protein n=1 Tax=Cadophora gregata TaxID=51156 RepID=UPI0026DB1704|nr:uncharacterized protein ONS95_013201 [Cadophora gregata]KAK0099981.1 hypothetical protein ONS96_007924 [Cadophora gregata f. sp. sojae]KAK0116171.1 hypothetical protein ONS95_013201 [Cadophora gregata]
MDVFSGIAGTVGLIDVLWKVSHYLSNVRSASKTIQKDIGSLEDEILLLITINDTIKNLEPTDGVGLQGSQSAKVREIWDNIKSTQKACEKTLLRLEGKLRFIIDGKGEASKGASSSGSEKLGRCDTGIDDAENDQSGSEKESRSFHSPGSVAPESGKQTILQGIKRTLRKQSLDPEIAKIQRQLQTYQIILSAMLTALNIISTQDGHQENGMAIRSLSEKEDSNHLALQDQLKQLIATAREDHSTELQVAMATITKMSKGTLNRHFSVPKPVGSSYTGRTAYLQELASTIEHNTSPQQYSTQKRFVVEGLGGSGKTQFCCRFAELNREKFWGIFFINGSSRETAKQSFKSIAERGGVADNERAAKDWLSSLSMDQPWLLIIDNVDDPDLEIDEFFPGGERGFILITTRVRENIKHGTIGRKWFTFNELEKESAIELLLRRARVKEPWSESTKALADTIAKALGYLPLCLVHAATAISKGLCKLHEYLGCFQDAVVRLRKYSKKKQPAASDKTIDVYLGVYSSYEVLYSKLEKTPSEENQDAIELLKIFAFFDRQNIRFDMLIAAAENPGLEAKAEKQARMGKKEKGIRDSWTIFFRELIFALRTEILKDRSYPVLPAMLRFVTQNTDDGTAVETFRNRLRMALLVLQQWSLATHDEDRDSYSIHPLIHDWVRSRPQMTLGEQAAWSQAAANTLEQSIILPINGITTPKDADLQRSSLLHLIYLRARRREMLATIDSNVKSRRLPRSLLPVITSKPDTIVTDRSQAKQSAKFSYIYFLCGRYREAQVLQEAVRDYLVPNLGLEHSLSMRVSRFLATTYWLGGGRFNDAAALTEKILDAAIRELGAMNEMTLSLMDELGGIRNFQGRFPEAKELL